MSEESSLIWSPTYEYLAGRIRAHGRLRLLIAPFIKLDALEALLEVCVHKSDLSIIVRWSGRDIVSGASDISVYPYLNELRVPLYVHPRIHLKLLVFNDALAFHTSGNITQRGLGLQSGHNIEIGCQIEVGYSDWSKIYEILNESTRVDDVAYNEARRYIEENRSKPPPLPSLRLQAKSDKRFSKLSLPSSPNPEELFRFYEAPGEVGGGDAEVAAFMHDLVLYQIPEGLDRRTFFEALGERFVNHPFTRAIVSLIQEEKSARFGLVNEWLTTNCSDKPTPYRWEMKSVTRRLYDWLDYFYPEISWDIPGAHSMVIRWSGASSS